MNTGQGVLKRWWPNCLFWVISLEPLVFVKNVSWQDFDFLMLISCYSNIFSVRPTVWLQSAEP